MKLLGVMAEGFGSDHHVKTANNLLIKFVVFLLSVQRRIKKTNLRCITTQIEEKRTIVGVAIHTANREERARRRCARADARRAGLCRVCLRFCRRFAPIASGGRRYLCAGDCYDGAAYRSVAKVASCAR
jgi:hypothetical protein